MKLTESPGEEVEGDGRSVLVMNQGDAAMAVGEQLNAINVAAQQVDHRIDLVNAIEEHTTVLVAQVGRSAETDTGEVAGQAAHLFKREERRLQSNDTETCQRGFGPTRQRAERFPVAECEREGFIDETRNPARQEKSRRGGVEFWVSMIDDNAIDLAGQLAPIGDDLRNLVIFRDRGGERTRLAPNRHDPGRHALEHIANPRDLRAMTILRADNPNS